MLSRFKVVLVPFTNYPNNGTCNTTTDKIILTDTKRVYGDVIFKEAIFADYICKLLNESITP